jgi:hypothetical protein
MLFILSVFSLLNCVRKNKAIITMIAKDIAILSISMKLVRKTQFSMLFTTKGCNHSLFKLLNSNNNMSQKNLETSKEYLNALGVLSLIATARQNGNCRQEGNTVIYRVDDEERRMSLEEMRRHEQTLAKYIGSAVELVSLIGKPNEKPKSSH